jgi:hypothetical protein
MMRIKGLIVAILVLFVSSVLAQSFNQMAHDEKLDKDVLVGYCDSIGLHQGFFGVYYKTQHETYKPKESIIRKIKGFFNGEDYELVVIFGDWCSDSKLQVGRFDKVLDEASFPKDKRKYIAVDRDRKTRDIDISKYNLSRVPTFIVFHNGLEKGRIVESPNRTLEKDLYNILKKKEE